MLWIIKLLPLSWQVRLCVCKAVREYGGTSHYRVEALRNLRKTSGLLLKDAKPLIDAEFARRNA
jgi:steroid 5-alpha reductase family enzyme